MDRKGALRKIRALFRQFGPISHVSRRYLNQLTSGNLYELFCLSKVVEILTTNYGFQINFVGSSLKFQSGPGAIHQASPHFDVFVSGQIAPIYQIFTDIEFKTLGSSSTHFSPTHTDNSEHHEIDIVVVEPNLAGHPKFDQIVLGVECKAHAVFIKATVKEVLGIRRELSFVDDPALGELSSKSSLLSKSVPANPCSEYWLAFLDPKGLSYQDSPKEFGIDFLHWRP